MQRREEEDRRFRELEERLSAKFTAAQQPPAPPAPPVQIVQPIQPIQPVAPAQPAPQKVKPIVVRPAVTPAHPTTVQPGAVMTTTTTTTIDATKKEKEDDFPAFKTGYRSSDEDGKYN